MNTAHDAFAALRYRDFSIVTVNQFCLTLAILIQEIIYAVILDSCYPHTDVCNRQNRYRNEPHINGGRRRKNRKRIWNEKR